ncbi:MAG: DUF4446 family protein [Candidatus Vogelbacteria bacterium]|nr:DUF4446 family protein [Candidatus Vogelbacteria bacterium]
MENVVYVIGAVAAILLVWIVVLELRIKKLLRGKSGDDLEDLIRKTNNDLDALIRSREEVRKDIADIRDRMRHYIRGVKTVRFNPFKDSGSNQSFATAFISDEGDGVVISSLYSRDRVGIYAKPLEDHKSEYELSDEEKRAINESQNHL